MPSKPNGVWIDANFVLIATAGTEQRIRPTAPSPSTHVDVNGGVSVARNGMRKSSEEQVTHAIDGEAT